MPVSLLGQPPLALTNLGILFSTALSGWGTYLLVFWLTKNRWAGVVAGVAFAIAPYRLGHITQLHLISTQWLPFVFLALARLIKLNRSRDLLLLLIFTNLQFFSVVNYAPLVALGAAIWSLPFFWASRRKLPPALLGRLAIFGAITLLLNTPVLQLYQQVSAQMGVVRTLGDAKIYGATLTNYILPMGNSLLYGRWLGLPTHIDVQFPGVGIFISTFPGAVVLLLAVAALLLSLRRGKSLAGVVGAVAALALVGFVLSFGANDQAFGSAAAPLAAKLLPYPYLYNWMSILQGLRVPIRFALLTTFGLSILAGVGLAALSRRFWPAGRITAMVAGAVCLLIVIEHLPAPLPGVSAPPPGAEYAWLRDHTPPDAAVIELPYYLHTGLSNQEVLREYQSAAHFRVLVNGTSGFKPGWLKSLGLLFDAFPNWQAFDAARQLGIDFMVLHQSEFEPAAWENITALLPGYLPAINSLHSVGDSLILELASPACTTDSAAVAVDAGEFPRLTLANSGPATWVADPRRPSRVTIGPATTDFLEPLFVLPGDSAQFELPVESTEAWQVALANLGQTLSPERPAVAAAEPPALDNWQPVQVGFANGAALEALAVSETPRLCGVLDVQLRWNLAAPAGETVRVELVDRFGREAVSSQAAPVESVSRHRLPLAESLPPGQYQLRVRFLTAAGDDIPALSQEGAVISQPLALPITIRPGAALPQFDPAPAATLANQARLLGVTPLPVRAAPGDWLRFTLIWQAEATIPQDYTVFTQLLGPDGQVAAQHDNPPAGGWYPVSLWVAGETVADDYALRLPPAAPAGQYRLIAGMYDAASGQRVPLATGGDFIELGAVSLP